MSRRLASLALLALAHAACAATATASDGAATPDAATDTTTDLAVADTTTRPDAVPLRDTAPPEDTPRPPPVTGLLRYTRGCRAVPEEMRAGCDEEVRVISTEDVDGGPPYVLAGCTMDGPTSGPLRVRFHVLRSESIEHNAGVEVCGEMPTVGEALRDGQVRLFWGRASIGSALSTGRCRVELRALAPTSFAGRLRCVDVPDFATPARYNFVRGIAGVTADPGWAEFALGSCVRGPVACAR